MAKFRRYRKYTRRGRSRWSSNLVDIGPNTFVLPTHQGWNHTEFTLITNPDYSDQLTSNLYTIKNVEVTLQFDATATSAQGIENVQFYIMYVPQTMYVGQDYAIKHPEYIMAMRYYGEPGQDATQAVKYSPSIKITSRLARKLNAGDRIILLIRAANSSNNDLQTTYGGLCRFWTKAN